MHPEDSVKKKPLVIVAAILLLPLVGVLGAHAVTVLLRPRQAAPSGPTSPPKPGEICEHTIPRAECPFCTPSLIESKGWCGGHKVPEALCTRCNAAVIPAFKAKGDWCGGHNLPESQCLACNPELAQSQPPPPKPSGSPAPPPGEGAWCNEHGVSESMCFICSPNLIEEKGICQEHGVPEALCTTCNPKLIPAFKATNDWCTEHAVPESQCVTCNPSLATPAPTGPPLSPEARRRSAPRVGCRKHTQKIQLASEDVVRQVGLVARPVTRAPFSDQITAAAEVQYPADRQAQLSSRVAGTVHEVLVDLGQWVEKGTIVATIDSPELGGAHTDLVSAAALLELWERNHTREVGLAESGVGTQRAVIEADTRRAEARAALTNAEQRLRNLGLTAEELALARQAGSQADSTLPLRAPFDGVVVSRSAVQGEVVSPAQALLTVVDTRKLWALIDVPEAATARIGLGQQVVLTLDAMRDEGSQGRIAWVSSELDRRTRTLKARVVVDNEQGRLRANMFGTAHITLGERRNALVVPREAVQWEGCCNVVFVPTGGASYMARKVQLGGASDGFVEVLTGVSEGEQVVVVGAFILKTEVLKGSIGAGCCEGE